MDGADDGGQVAWSLANWLATLTFVDEGVPQVTALLLDSIAAWAAGQGWRVYRRAPSVMPLPPPYSHRPSCLDIACARPTGPPIAIEVDRAHRQRSIDKLLAEAAAGRVPIWVRWGSRRFEPPPLPVRMVTCQVMSRTKERPAGDSPPNDRPPPVHTDPGGMVGEQTGLFPDAEHGH
jgi:hypothetical protein